MIQKTIQNKSKVSKRLSKPSELHPHRLGNCVERDVSRGVEMFDFFIM